MRRLGLDFLAVELLLFMVVTILLRFVEYCCYLICIYRYIYIYLFNIPIYLAWVQDARGVTGAVRMDGSLFLTELNGRSVLKGLAALQDVAQPLAASP